MLPLCIAELLLFGGLAAVSQRQVTEFFPGLLHQRQQVLRDIREFHATHLRGRFALPDYTCDLYINTKGHVSGMHNALHACAACTALHSRLLFLLP